MKRGDYVKVLNSVGTFGIEDDSIYEVYCIDNEGYLTLKNIECDIHITNVEKID